MQNEPSFIVELPLNRQMVLLDGRERVRLLMQLLGGDFPQEHLNRAQRRAAQSRARPRKRAKVEKCGP